VLNESTSNIILAVAASHDDEMVVASDACTGSYYYCPRMSWSLIYRARKHQVEIEVGQEI
jgi:hypothetical protein